MKLYLLSITGKRKRKLLRTNFILRKRELKIFKDFKDNYSRWIKFFRTIRAGRARAVQIEEVYFTERANWPSISENTTKKASAEVLPESSLINAQHGTMKRLYQEIRMF